MPWRITEMFPFSYGGELLLRLVVALLFILGFLVFPPLNGMGFNTLLVPIIRTFHPQQSSMVTTSLN